jgi:hypothetical protein
MPFANVGQAPVGDGSAGIAPVLGPASAAPPSLAAPESTDGGGGAPLSWKAPDASLEVGASAAMASPPPASGAPVPLSPEESPGPKEPGVPPHPAAMAARETVAIHAHGDLRMRTIKPARGAGRHDRIPLRA